MQDFVSLPPTNAFRISEASLQRDADTLYRHMKSIQTSSIRTSRTPKAIACQLNWRYTRVEQAMERLEKDGRVAQYDGRWYAR